LTYNLKKYYVLRVILVVYCLYFVFALLQGHRILSSRPSLPEEGGITAKVTPADSEALEAFENQDEDGAKGSLEGNDSTLSPPIMVF
jgi:hypothetical protein